MKVYVVQCRAFPFIYLGGLEWSIAIPDSLNSLPKGEICISFGFSDILFLPILIVSMFEILEAI